MENQTRMLVLSRHIGESIVIDKNITVTIIGIRKGKVRFGIDAPKDVCVDREEVHKIRTKD